MANVGLKALNVGRDDGEVVPFTGLHVSTDLDGCWEAEIGLGG